jgi:hypothetical protein
MLAAKKIALALLLGFGVTGCTLGNFTSIQKRVAISPPSTSAEGAPAAVLIDAKQRALLSNQVWHQPVKGKAYRTNIVCAEPSPDVLSAIAAQAGASFESAARSLQAQGGVGEAAANIGLRTQTIQTLRDGFYRVCEAYMNGLDETQYSIMLRRYQANMIALLAIEQLTGAVRGSDALVSATPGDAIDMKAAYLHRANIAEAEVNRLTEEIAAAGRDKTALTDKQTACENAGDDKPEGCKPEEIEARKKQIAALDTKTASLTREKDLALARKNTNTQLAADADNRQASAGGVISSRDDRFVPPQTAVAQAVEKISLAVLNSDYGPQLCIEYLRRHQPYPNNLIRQCNVIFDEYQRRLRAETRSINSFYDLQSTIVQAAIADKKITKDEIHLIRDVMELQSMHATSNQTAQNRLQPVRNARVMAASDNKPQNRPLETLGRLFPGFTDDDAGADTENVDLNELAKAIIEMSQGADVDLAGRLEFGAAPSDPDTPQPADSGKPGGKQKPKRR